MLRKPITYVDFDGNTVTEDYYFNLTKAELIELELSTPGGFTEHLTKIAQSNDGAEIIKQFKKIIKLAYGVRSEDGKRFIKKPELFEEFSQTEAYSQLFMELATEAHKSAEFINGLVPQDLARQARESAQNVGTPASQAVAAEPTQVQAAVQNPARRVPQDRLPKQVKEQHRTVTQLPQPEVTEGSNSATDGESQLPETPEKTHYTMKELAEMPGDMLRRLQERGLDGDPASGYTVRPPHESGPGFSSAE